MGFQAQGEQLRLPPAHVGQRNVRAPAQAPLRVPRGFTVPKEIEKCHTSPGLRVTRILALPACSLGVLIKIRRPRATHFAFPSRDALKCLERKAKPAAAGTISFYAPRVSIFQSVFVPE